jgi:hypothetical protein
MTRRSVWLAGIAMAVALVGVSAAWAQDVDPAKAAARAVERTSPEQVDPNEIKGEDWVFNFQFDQPEPIIVTTPGGEKEVYWYLVYTVTNPAKEEKNYVPTFTLFGDTAAVRRAGVFPTVFDAILKARKVRFLENAVKMMGKVFPGEDNARTGVAIFAPLDRETNQFTIFVEGLSGQFIERPNLKAKPDAPPEEKVVRLRKTLALTYKLPGDKWWLNQDQPIFVSKKWTWR